MIFRIGKCSGEFIFNLFLTLYEIIKLPFTLALKSPMTFNVMSRKFYNRSLIPSFVLMGLFIIAPQGVLADGFICEAINDNLEVRVFNHTKASVGTRNVSVMVVSDPTLNFGERTLLSLNSKQNSLVSRGAHYNASLNFNSNEVSKEVADKPILGIKLSEIKNIALRVNFSYAYPVKKGTIVDAILTLIDRNDNSHQSAFNCERYLKN